VKNSEPLFDKVIAFTDPFWNEEQRQAS